MVQGAGSMGEYLEAIEGAEDVGHFAGGGIVRQSVNIEGVAGIRRQLLNESRCWVQKHPYMGDMVNDQLLQYLSSTCAFTHSISSARRKQP